MRISEWGMGEIRRQRSVRDARNEQRVEGTWRWVGILQSAVGEDTQGFSLLNRLTALADVEFPVDVLQVSFGSCC